MAANKVTLQLVDAATPLDGVTTLDYLPFGVKMLKLRVQRNQALRPDDLGPIVIHPAGYTAPDVKAPDAEAHKWRAYGTATGAPELWVVWGAGIEAGSPVRTKEKFPADKTVLPLDDDDVYYAYLHLVHRPDDPGTHSPGPYQLTMQATDDKGVQGEVTFNLTVPATAVNPLRPPWTPAADTDGVSTIRFGGATGDARPVDVPEYVSRWWPRPAVTYRPADAALTTILDQLQILFQRNAGNDKGQLTVRLGADELAFVDGDIGLPLHDYRLFLPELFRFPDDHHLLLRLWFYWANLRFTTEELGRYVPDGRRDGADWQQEIARVRQSMGSGLLPFHKNDEVPDLERLDILIDPVKRQARHVGTDTHWQEFWLRTNNDRVLATIASTAHIHRVVIQNKLVPRIEEPVTIPLQNGLCDIIHEGSDHKCPFRPEGKVVRAEDYDDRVDYAICPGCETRFTGAPERAVGLIGKHAPFIREARIIRNTVSNNVLKG